MASLYEGNYCGACHDGDTAFASNTRCTACHIGVNGYERLKRLEEVKTNFLVVTAHELRTPLTIIKGYLEGDTESNEYAVLMEWDNIYYTKPTKKASTVKTVVRLGLIQWQMRPYPSLDDMMQQVEYFIDSVAAYRCDFAVSPEFFNAPSVISSIEVGFHVGRST